MAKVAKKTKRIRRAKNGVLQLRVVKRSEELEESLLDHLANGGSVLGWCDKVGLKSSSVYRWMIDDPELAQRFARARQQGLAVIEDEILAIADGRDLADENDVNRRKLRIYAREKRLAWGDSEKYGTKTQIRQDVTHRVELSDVEREVRIKQLLEKAGAPQAVEVEIEDAAAGAGVEPRAPASRTSSACSTSPS